MDKRPFETPTEDSIRSKFGEKTVQIGNLDDLRFKEIQHLSDIQKANILGADPGYNIAFFKYDELVKVFTSARYALVQASHEKHERVYSSKPGLAQLWIRSEFAKNGIIWYNSCYDYILQVIYFAFDFWGCINSPESYLKELKRCKFEVNKKDWKYKNNTPSFKEIAGSNKEADDLYQNLIDFYHKGGEENNKLLKWANLLKHNGAIAFEGLSFRANSQFVYSSGFKTSYAEPLFLNIDEVIDILIKEHKKIVKFANYLYCYMNFDTILEASKKKFNFFEIGELPKKFSAQNLKS